MILRPGLFLQNRYEILEKIGTGGMSVVYKAKCHKLNRFVAIKVLKDEFCADQEFVARFNMEAQAAAGLVHPNIVNVFDVVDEEDLHYIVMELVDGITLKSYIAAKRHLEVKQSIAIAIQVCQGINAAHERKIIHRDIKPQNIMLSKEGKVKVADFGIARAVTKQTIGQTAIGSVHYISPEQAKGDRADERSDVYSMGIMLYEMLTGRVPFDGESAVNIAIAHLEKRPVSPSKLNPAIPAFVEEIILKCIKKKRERRYQSMRELEIALIHARDTIKKAEMLPPQEIDSTNTGTKRFSQDDVQAIRATEEVDEIEEIDDDEIEEDEIEDISDDDISDDNISDENISNSNISNENISDKKISDRKVEKQKKNSISVPKVYMEKGEELEDDEADSPRKIDKVIARVGFAFAGIIIGLTIFIFMNLGNLFGSGDKRQTEDSQTTIASNQVEMPDVVGLNQDLAEKKLKDSSIQMKISKEEYDDEIEKGDIISQNPKAGEVVSKYSNVEVVISKGSDKVDIKKLGIDKMKAVDAKSALESIGFSVEIEERDSETVEKDYVIGYSPESPKKGSLVTLYKSTGKKVVLAKVPYIVSLTEDNAKKAIKDAGFEVGNVAKQFDAEIAKGIVIGQEFEPGKELEKGKTIGFTISDGPPLETTLESTEPTSTVDNSTISNNPPTAPTAATTEAIKYRYTGSINTTYELSDLIGPGASQVSLKVMVRLKQIVNGQTQYTTLMEPRTITGDTILPLRFNLINGAYGVEQGQVEVVKINESGGYEVIKSFDVEFFKGQ
jgi:hypothetical protein